MAKANGKISLLTIIILQSLVGVFSFILIFLFLSAVMGYGIPKVFPFTPTDIKFIIEKLYIDLYEFHFANITIFFIILSGQYIKKFYNLNAYLFFLILGLLNIIYVFVVNNVLNKFHLAYAYQHVAFTKSDFFIAIYSIYFFQFIRLYFYFNFGKLYANKKIIRYIYQSDNPIFFAIIFYIYFAQYSFLYRKKNNPISYIVMFIIIIYIFYIFYVVWNVNRLNRYCKRIKNEGKDYNVWVYYADELMSRMVFKYYLKPCIKLTINPMLNGVILSREQYGYCRQYIQDSNCVGIDFYSRIFLSSEPFYYTDQFQYSIAIRESLMLESDEDERKTISGLQSCYFSVLTLDRVGQLNSFTYMKGFFDKIRIDILYTESMRKAKREIFEEQIITGIKNFDQYLMLDADKKRYELDRYTAFSSLVKGYEAIMRYICVYYLILYDVKLEDVYGKCRIMEKVEDGALGSWIDMVYHVLKREKAFSNCWLGKKVNVKIIDSFKLIGLSHEGVKTGKMMEKKEMTYYQFFLEKIINLRNWTIGHGSSSYVPDDNGLVNMYKVYLYFLKEVQINFSDFPIKENTIWMIIYEDNIAFLDKFIAENNKYRYIDYLAKKIYLVDKEM